jgi:hypothetical protein
MSQRMMCGPFVVETVNPEYFISSYRTWLPSDPSKVWEFKNSRELEAFFQAVCSQTDAAGDA